MLSVTRKPYLLSAVIPNVVMLSVVAPFPSPFPFFLSKHYSNKVLVGFRKIAATIGQKTFGQTTMDLVLLITLLLHEI
jgi:hypothetical protein